MSTHPQQWDCFFPRNNHIHEKQDHSMALRQINARLGLYEIQAKK